MIGWQSLTTIPQCVADLIECRTGGRRPFVGYSLELCIRDVLDGIMPINAIDRIMAVTAAQNAQEWEDLADRYALIWWRQDPERARNLLRFFLQQGRITTIYLDHLNHPDTYWSHWTWEGIMVLHPAVGTIAPPLLQGELSGNDIVLLSRLPQSQKKREVEHLLAQARLQGLPQDKETNYKRHLYKIYGGDTSYRRFPLFSASP